MRTLRQLDMTIERGAPEEHAGPAQEIRSGHYPRTVRVMWQREVVRLWRSPTRVLFGLLSPLLFLLVLGTGLAPSLDSLDYRLYLVPGVLLMAVQVPAVNTGVSIVWDRQAGLLREMLVAPVRRSALLTGICLGGTTAALCHGFLMLVFSVLIGIFVPAHLLVLLLLELAVITFTLTALGVLVAVSVRRAEMFQAVVGLALMPLLFLSGALFPVNGLPSWLTGAVLLNPLSYGVDAMRRTLPSDGFAASAQSGPHLWGWQPPVWLELVALALLGLIALATATRRFSRVE